MTAIHIDLESKVAPFEQIKVAIIDAIAGGGLPSGHRLPTIRQLAGDLGVANNTVARAYRELEAGGFVRSSGRRGTMVLALPDAMSGSTQTDAMTEAVRSARLAGIDDAAILAAAVAALAS